MSALGSLVVKLGLEYAEFTGGLGKSEQAALAASKKIQDTMDGLKGKLVATAGAIAGGLAAGFTIAAFKNMITGAIETGAAFDDLSIQTGASVAALKELAAVGKFNDMGPEQIGAAMNKLSANLAGTTEESKGAGKALEALGLDFNKLRQMRPEDQMQAVAKAMGEFEDGTGKSAVAMALYGKEGAKMLPFMKDLAEVEDLKVKLTKEQIEAQKKLSAQSANLDDNIRRLGTSGEAWKKELANGMIPALDLGAQALLDMVNGSGGLRDEVKKLAADGSIKEWTTTAIKGLSYVADAGQIAWRVLQSIGKGVGGLLAAMDQSLQGDFKGAWNSLKDAGKDMIDVFDAPTVGARFRESLDKVTTSAAAAGESVKKPAIDFRNLGNNIKAAAEAKDPFDALRDTIVKSTAAYQAEATAGEKLTEGQKKAVDVLDQVRSGKVKVTQAQAIQIGKDIEAMLAAEGENKAREEFIKIADAERAARVKILQTMEQAAASVETSNTALREELELIGLTEEQQVRVLQYRNHALILTKEATLAELERASAFTGTMTREEIALQAEIAALRERNQLLGAKHDKTVVAKAAEQAKGEWTKFTDSVYDGLTDSLYRGFESGKGFFKTFWDGLKNTVKTTVLKFGVQGVMTGVSGALGFAGTAANAASGASTVGTALSGASFLSNAAGILGGAGTAAGYGASALFAGNGLGALSGGFGMLTGGGGLGMAAQGAGMIAGVLGPIALGVGAVMALVKKLDDSGTMHTGSLSQYSAAGGLANSTTHGAFGMGFGGVDYSAETEKFTGAMAQSIVMMLDSTATTFGKEAGYKAATAFADDTSKDGAWGGLLITKLNETIVNWDPSRTSKWAPKEFADGAAGKEQYLAAVAADVRGALESIGLPAWATGMLNKLGQGASIEQMAGVIDQINTAKAMFVSFGQYMPIFAGLADAALGKLVDASGGVGALAGNMSAFVDGFYTDAEKLAVNTQNVTDAMAKLGFEMPTTREEFKALVQVQMALGEAGAANAAGLLRLSGAMDAVMQATDAVTDATKAATKAENDLAAARQGAVRTAMQALASSLSGMRDGVADADARMAGARMEIWSGYADAQAELIALERQAADATRGFAQSLRVFVTGLAVGPNSAMGLDGRYSALQRQLQDTAARAGSGDQGARDSLTSVASAYLDAARSRASTSVDYARDEARVSILLGKLATQAEDDPLVQKYDAQNLTLQQQIADAQIDVVKYLALMEATGTSTDLGIQTVDKTLAALRDEYVGAAQAQAGANLKLDVALAALDALGLTESLVNAVAANQASSLSAALNISDEALASITGALGLTPDSVSELGKQFGVELALLVGQAATDLAAALDGALAFDPAAFDALRTVIGYDTASPDFAALQTILGFDLESDKFRSLQTILGMAPDAAAQVDALLGGIGFASDAAAQAAALTAGIAFADVAREQIALIAAGVSLTDAAGAQVDGLNAGVGWSADVAAQVQGLLGGLSLTAAASDQVNGLLAGLTLSAGASAQVDGLLAGLQLAAADRVTVQQLLGGIGFDADTATALQDGLGLRAGLLPTLGTALGLSAEAAKAIGVISGMGSIDQAVSNAYASIGRVGIGNGASQVDRQGWDYWRGQLASGALSMAGFEQAFLDSAAATVREQPGSGLSDHVSPYLKKLGLPGFAVGTSYVPSDMVAQIHRGEEITPRPYVDVQAADRREANRLLAQMVKTNADIKTEMAALKTELSAIKGSGKDSARVLLGIEAGVVQVKQKA